ncbi:arginine--tRNA ligase [Canibacter sp. lx-45]|uniref:arginine--tRNA ligase n=1 Tax=Canibacter zhuwentaonis TaxID=2837491 RepID=UPI001BDCE54B|nr:arginine--tRNA ligase [Canibacter zhuwentaonis]MBT1034779.1 arginine--tRNA ligase [Canibacter zhuwentaonis]
MNPAQISSLLKEIMQSIVDSTPDSGELNLADANFTPERPKNRAHGDWASNIAMQFAKKLGTNPRELAGAITAELVKNEGIAKAEIAGPGFINITLDAAAAGAVVSAVLAAGDSYGTSEILAGRRINMEFVSANPTGPLHLGHTRWAALGDSLARVLRAAGAAVVSEYYINDAGEQMRKFGRSVRAAALRLPTPEDGYPGEYIGELGAVVNTAVLDFAQLAEADQLAQATEIAYQQQLSEIKDSLKRFNVNFDVWFSERTMHSSENGEPNAIATALSRLREQGHVYDADGAVWVRTTDFGDDKDRVYQRSNGIYTYFAADAAYYLSKTDRGSDIKIYLLGADHHGYVGRLKAISGAAGEDPEKNIIALIGQLVNLNGARLSKRAGNIVELNDLLEWLGCDALRYWLARYPADSPLSLDGEKLRSRTNDNPVFYVQYAHARTQSVARNAATVGLTRADFTPELLTHETESNLLGKLQEYPLVVAAAAQLYEPHRVARYLEELTAAYHRWYDNCRVLPQGDEAPSALHATRLCLNDATSQVIRNGLNLIGVSAPERM